MVSRTQLLIILSLVLVTKPLDSPYPFQIGFDVFTPIYSVNPYSDTYNSPFSYPPDMVLAVLDLESSYNILTWGFSLVCGLTYSTSFSYNVITVGPSLLIEIGVQWLAVDHYDFPNFMYRYFDTPFNQTPDGLATGSGYRSQNFTIAITGGTFPSGQSYSMISCLCGFYGTADAGGFDLQSSATVYNNTYINVKFTTSGNNIFTNGSVYVVAYLNNLSTYADVGHLYGFNNTQLNTMFNITVSGSFYFSGITRFLVNGTNITLLLDSTTNNSLSTTSRYWNVTYSYLYIIQNVLCGGANCVCFDGYYQNTTNGCVEICGDGRVYTLPCDDGNYINGDGCSSTCQVQPFYSCFATGGRSASICWLVGPITLTFLDIYKFVGETKANITFAVTPNYANLSTLIPWSSLTINNNLISMDFISYVNGILSIVGSYTQTLEGQPMTLTVNPPLSGYFMHVYQSNSTVMVQAISGLPAIVFTQDEIQLGQGITYLAIIVDSMYWLVFLIGLYCTKINAIEMMSVLQMSTLALVTLDYKSAAIQNLPYFRYSLGYNPLFQNVLNYSTLRLQRLGFLSQFLSDYNMMILTILILLIVCLIVCLHNKGKDKDDPQNIQAKNARAKNLMHVTTDYFMTVALLNVYGIVFACTINFVNQPIIQIQIADAVVGLFMVLVLIGAGIYYGLMIKQKTVRMFEFKQYLKTFKVDQMQWLRRYHPLFMMTDRFVFSILVGIIGQQSYSTYVLIGWVTLYTLYIAIRNPYQLLRNYFRSLATQLCVIANLGLYCYMRNSTTISREAYTTIPYIVMGILLFNLIGNVPFIGIGIRQHLIEVREQNAGRDGVKKILATCNETRQVQVQMQFLKGMRQRALKVLDVKRDWNQSAYVSFNDSKPA